MWVCVRNHQEVNLRVVAELVRKKKTFEDGDGPPPDPAYNFLADSERDGTEGRSSERKRIGQEPQSSAFRKTGSFRRQNSSHSNSSGSGGAGPAGGNSNNNYQKGKREGGGFKSSPPTGEYKKPIQFDQQPKKNLETNWRTQSRDIDKATTTNTGQFGAAASPLPLHSNGGDGQMDDKNPAPIHHQFNSNLPTMRPIVGCSSQNQPVAVPTTTITTSPTVVRQPLPIVRPPPALQTEDQKEVSKELVVEQRGNIQISVSKDGEIQSVKRKWENASEGGWLELERCLILILMRQFNYRQPSHTLIAIISFNLNDLSIKLIKVFFPFSLQWHLPGQRYQVVAGLDCLVR